MRNVAYLMFGLVMLVFGYSLAGPRAGGGGGGGGGMQEMKVEELVTRLGANLAAQKARRLSKSSQRDSIPSQGVIEGP